MKRQQKAPFSLRRLALLSAPLPVFHPFAAHADGGLVDLIPIDGLANNTIMFPVFMGAFAFAMWSATWLIRARRQLEQDNAVLALEHADLKTRHERAQALLEIPDQRIVIWADDNEPPRARGKLPPVTGAPEDDDGFVAFGTWMRPGSAQSFEAAVDRLRQRAEAFDLTVESNSGSMIEVQGRASGNYAFVRFIPLSGERAALASLEAEHTRLVQTTDTMKSLLETVPFPVWMRDAEGALNWANQAYVKAVDADTLEDINRSNTHLLDSTQRDRIAEYHQKQRLEKKASQFRERIPATVAGDRRSMDVSEVSIEGGTAGLAVDMSEVEDIQVRLRRTQESHAQTLNQLATAVAIFDQDRRLTFHNDAFERLWDLPPELLNDGPNNGQLFDRLRDAGKLAEQPDWSKWRNGLLKVFEATQPQEYWWHLPDGRTLRAVANPHEHGGATWLFENITEQLEMESRYIALTQVQGETLDHLSEAIAVFAADGRLKLSNPSFQNLWKLEDENVATETPIAVVADACAENAVERATWDELITGVTGVSDSRSTRAGRMTLENGAILDYALVPLPNGQTMLSFADVSANVNLEQTLKEKNEALEAAEKLKNDFIKHVSYEFRAPLTNIKGFAEMMSSQAFGKLNERQDEYVDHITSSANVLHALVDNLLDLATVDAGILELELQTISLKDVVFNAAHSVRDQLSEKSITLNLAEPRAMAHTHFVADPARVQQVLFNLLNNAIKFTPENGDVSLEASADDDIVTFSVIDSGPGVPKGKRSGIFDRFASSSASGGLRGAGLGLSIARSLVELHGGSIELDESRDEGACFICRFPRKPAVEREPVTIAAQ